jgi:hypothetical protein
MATGNRMDGTGSIPESVNFFLFSTESRPTLGPTQPPIQWVPETLSRGVRWQGREDDLPSPSNVEVKKGGAVPLLPYVIMA